jgi:two-component system sensor histidine kinase and response regulator WspE
MKPSPPDDLSNLSMLELFGAETETQTAILTRGLLELEKPSSPATAGPVPPRGMTEMRQKTLDTLMRAAHSLKGAARIVNVPVGVRVAHAMEELGPGEADVLLRGVDLLVSISASLRSPASRDGTRTTTEWERQHAGQVEAFLNSVGAYLHGPGGTELGGARENLEHGLDVSLASAALSPLQTSTQTVETVPAERDGRMLRLTAENLNRLLALAGETLVESRWLRPFHESMQRLKRMQGELEHTLEDLRQSVDPAKRENLPEFSRDRLNKLCHQTAEARQYLAGRLEELDLYDRRTAHLSNRLYLEVLRARMRPFGDGVRRFPRMVRDLARSLGKQVKLEIHGENTQVDRDILERLEAPLNHLLRNAVDHGCETPEQRKRAGKPAEGTIRLEARHSAGMLMIVVADDGAGVDPGRVRRVIADKKLAAPALTEHMSEPELLQFLFLPGFTVRDEVTEISGRGVGLDIVQNMVKSVRGNARVSSEPGRGMRFQLQLPLTLSVLRTLLVEVGGEHYAIPLAQIVSTLKLPRERIESLEGRHHFKLGEEQIGLLAAHQLLDSQQTEPREDDLPVVVLGEPSHGAGRYGLLVDRFLGERELVVQPLDPRLGKVKDISAAALMEDGAPVLIVDVDDVVRSIEKLIAAGALAPQGGITQVAPGFPQSGTRKRKRILAVDDSLTVRELERKLLLSHGYLADVAVDGMEAWNAVRTGAYDLVITDVDMPRMDGIELATLIKRDPQLKSLPVMIVSYKDREEDRLRGLEAGADYYLTKGNFQDDTLLQAVQDLIGEPDT